MSVYRVWCPERGDEDDCGRDVEAPDHEDAACAWAERDDRDSAEYLIARDGGCDVIVRGPDGINVPVRVRAEQCINYYGRRRPTLGDRVEATPALETQ